MDSPPTQTVLDYASPQPPSHGLHWLLASTTKRLVRFIRWLPRPVVAVLLTLPALALCLAPWDFLWSWQAFYLQRFLLALSLFLPGSIRRLNWRHALIAALFAAVAFGVERLSADLTWPRKNPFASYFLTCSLDVLLVLICEMAVARQLHRQALAWIAGVALGIGALVSTASYLIQFSDTSISFHFNNSQISLPVSAVLMPPLFGAVVWMAIPATLALLHTTKGQTRIRMVIAASIGVVLTSYVILFRFLIYPLAARSLMGDGPWRPTVACDILTTRGTEADFECIWRGVENSDWKTRLEDPEYHLDWREWIIKSLGKSRPSATARRLSLMLRTRPSRLLSGYAAPLIASEKRYEAVPSLLRYAILPRTMLDVRIGDELIELHVPQAALQGISFWMVNSKGTLVLMPDMWTGGDPFLGSGRNTFESLLHAKAPATRREAFDLFWQLESSSPTSLPEPQRREVARLMNCIKRYWDAWQGDALSAAIPQPDWDNAPIELLERQVDDFVREMQRLRRKGR
jgi:hypothetical protein